VPLEIRRLRPDDDRRGFHSGDIDLDRFFQRFAGQNQFRHHIGVTYIAIENERVVGFATVAPAEIDIKTVPDQARQRLPGYPLPVLRLGRLAVDDRDLGRGIGLALLRTVFGLAKKMAVELGCIGIVVDAKPDAMTFYAHHGFRAMHPLGEYLGDRPRPTPMLLVIGAIPDSGDDPPSH
jgi:GNAT superfamily N-acetyltransferase